VYDETKQRKHTIMYPKHNISSEEGEEEEEEEEEEEGPVKIYSYGNNVIFHVPFNYNITKMESIF